MSHWQEYDHTADIGIEVWAESYTELAMEAGFALAELTTDTETISHDVIHTIVVEEVELDLLLVEFLKELLYLQETEEFIAISFKKPKYWVDKKADKFILTCQAIGGMWNVEEHESRAEIKAVTYHDLVVSMKKRNDWYARVLFDV